MISLERIETMKDNRGVSLVEIIVVIAIIGLLAVGATSGWNYINYADTSKCAKEINGLMIRTRVQAMSKEEKPYLYIYKKGTTYYSLVSTSNTFPSNPDGSKLANKKVTISYTYKDPVGSLQVHEIGDGDYIKIDFDKSTGGFVDTGIGAIEDIKIQGSSTYTIHLYKVTGKTKMQ